jgi:hypothetical protein
MKNRKISGKPAWVVCDQHDHQPGLGGDDQVGRAGLPTFRKLASLRRQAAVQQAEAHQEAQGEPAQQNAVNLPQTGGGDAGQGEIGDEC